MGIHYIKPLTPQTNYNLSFESQITTFSKNELNLILSIYGKKVAQGIWKDYAIDHAKDYAIFSIYRSTFEKAFLRVKKNHPKIKKQKQYSLLDVNQKKIKESDFLIDIINQLKTKRFQII
tara:strand:+ start:5419 stop:5778 length:360 start_codon:yes stop_codon:yes gene_type:complete